MSSYSWGNGYYGNLCLDRCYNPPTYKRINQPVPQAYQVNQPLPQAYQVNQPLPQAYKVNHHIPQTYKDTNQPVLQAYQLNQPLPQAYKVNHHIPQTYKVTNQPVPQAYKVTNHPVIIRCRAESQVLNTSSTPLIKHKRYEVLKVVTNPQIIKQEENLPLNVIKASDIKEEEINSNEQGDPNDNIPEVDIWINNVVSRFNVRCHLNLRQIALNGSNVVYKRGEEIVYMKIRKPYVTAWIRSSGKVTCTGATSDEEAKTASRKIARQLQQLGFGARFCNFHIVNVMCTCTMHFGINLIKFAEKHKGLVEYEPELYPWATYRIKEPKATLKIFTTGSISVIAPCVKNAQLAIEYIYPLVEEFKTAKLPSEMKGRQLF